MPVRGTGWVGVVSTCTFVARFAAALAARVRGLAGRSLVIAIAVGASAPAWAQGGPNAFATPALKQRYEALFARNLANPSDLDAAFQFAEVSTQIGDYEAAIGALERMVFYNPNLPRVKLELGVLYFRLGSYEMARSYLSAAMTGPDVPSEVRNRVEMFVTEIDRRAKPSQWSGFAQVGIRHQSNANAGPNTLSVRAFGFDAVLNQQFRKQPDTNWFALAGVRFVHDFGNQRGDALEASLIGYYAGQAKFDRLNTGLVEVNIGPRLALMPDAWMGSSLKPYLVATTVALGDNPYLNSWGGGMLLSFPMGLAVIEPGVEVRQRVYEASTNYPSAPDQNGQLISAYVLGNGALFGSMRWQGRLALNRNESRFAYNTYDQTTADISFPYEFDAAFLPRPRKWTLSPSFGWSRTVYEAPNFIVDPTTKRRDTELRTGLLLDAPLSDTFGFSAQVQYSVTNSNLPNFDTRNLSVLAGPTARF